MGFNSITLTSHKCLVTSCFYLTDLLDKINKIKEQTRHWQARLLFSKGSSIWDEQLLDLKRNIMGFKMLFFGCEAYA